MTLPRKPPNRPFRFHLLLTFSLSIINTDGNTVNDHPLYAVLLIIHSSDRRAVGMIGVAYLVPWLVGWLDAGRGSRDMVALVQRNDSFLGFLSTVHVVLVLV